MSCDGKHDPVLGEGLGATRQQSLWKSKSRKKLPPQQFLISEIALPWLTVSALESSEKLH
jgi:hypothetical protein